MRTRSVLPPMLTRGICRTEPPVDTAPLVRSRRLSTTSQARTHVYQTDQYEGMIAETVTMRGHNGDAINPYVARPLGERRRHDRAARRGRRQPRASLVAAGA